MRNKLIAICLIPILSLTSCGTNEKEYSKGYVENKVYYSEFLELQFTAPDEFTFLSQDQIRSLVNDVSVIYDEDAFFNAENASLIEFYATASDNSSINLTIDKSKRRTSIDNTVETFKTSMTQLYSQIGITCSFSDAIDYTLGENYSCKKITASFSGVSMKQYLYISQIGKYICSIACTDVSGTHEAKYEATFSDYVVEETEE